MPDATVGDVKDELDTSLSPGDIHTVLERAARDIDREYGNSVTFSDTQHRADFEAALTALRIASANAPDATDRQASDVQTGRTSQTYEVSVIDRLRKTVRRRDPGNAFGRSAKIIRDTDRHISSTKD